MRRRTRQRFLGIAVLVPSLWFGLTLGANAGDSLEQEGFHQVVSYHLETHPSMEIQDLYKLVFQAAMGSEHAVPNREAARQWLERELATLTAISAEPLSEPLSPDGTLVRVNLRSFAERGGDMDHLLDAFVATADHLSASQEKLREYWTDVEAMAESGEIPFAESEVRQLFVEMESRGFPAVHHSDTYRNHYEPAYRVVLLELVSSDAVTITGQ